ncbi:hypothetical protein HYZ41_03400 [archaeon]|nr:hypothetical protein [archaeon]
MSKKKGFTSDKYKEEILQALQNQPFMSTNEISDNLSMGYDTTLKYLLALFKTNKIKLKTVGNRRFWYK